MRGWPTSEHDLIVVQHALARIEVAPWFPPPACTIGGVWFVAPTGSRGDRAGEVSWAAAVVLRDRRVVADAVLRGTTGWGYRAGRLALREGPLLERAVRALDLVPDVLLVNATGRDHPRRAGLALHLGAVLSVPTVGVTDRPLVAVGGRDPGPARGDRSALRLGDDVVAALVRTRPGSRPVVVHPGWRTDLATAVAVTLGATSDVRTPEPLRLARRLARLARTGDAR